MKLLSTLLDLVFPPRCVFCHELLPLHAESAVCEHCQKSQTRFKGEEKAEFVERVVAPFRYENDIKESVHRYKFSGREHYAETYALYMADCLRESHMAFDILSYVPLHPRRRRSRGYDQAERLALELAKLLGVEVTPLLKKVHTASPQSQKKSAAERRANISGCYALLDGAAVEDRRILLVDDVFTTGATLSECARVLLMAGAEEVSAVTVASAHRK